MIFCEACGKQLPDDARFCFACGEPTSRPYATASNGPTAECPHCHEINHIAKPFSVMGTRSIPPGYQNRMTGGGGFRKAGIAPGGRIYLTCRRCGGQFAATLPGRSS
jgi:hypothetical protein